MKILGIETSCDETSASVVENGTVVLSNIIATSVDMHSLTGGIVPEVAAREHIRQISPVVDKAMSDANCTWNDIDAIAVTYTPGLMASLLIGINTAEAISYIHKKPLIKVNHIYGHIYANYLKRNESDIKFPLIVMTISGGHNEIILMKGHHDFEVIGETLDDAAGEAFDKVARLLNLGFPGGPIISKRALEGDPKAYKFPRVMLDKENNKYNFSFSGLKSAVKREVENLKELSEKNINDLSASFEMAVVDTLSDKLVLSAEEYGVKQVHLAGGVSANRLLRQKVREKLPDNIELIFPVEHIFCTDNAAMIASAAYFMGK